MEAWQLEDEVEIEDGAPASVSDVGAASGADHIVSEGSQASGDVGVLADAGSVLGEGGVAHEWLGVSLLGALPGCRL
jgi:hypothetical protein